MRLWMLLYLLLPLKLLAADIKIDNPWVRGTLEGQSMTGAFMTIKSDKTLYLLSAESTVAKLVEVHSMVMERGVMRMRAIERLAIPANKEVQLTSGGYHIMLMDLSRPLKEGESIPIKLIFEDAEKKQHSVSIQAPVRALTAKEGGHQHHH